MKMMARLFFTVASLELALIYTYHHLETTRRLRMLGVFHQIITENRIDGMKVTLAKKYSRNFFLFNKFVEHQIGFFTLLAVIWSVFLTYHAYYDEMIEHNLALLLLNGVNFTLFVRQLVILGILTAVMFTMTTMYLKYRFIGVLTLIRTCVRTRSNLNMVILQHKSFGDLLAETSPFVNLTLGLVYYVSPVIIVIPMQMAADQDSALWKRGVMANFFMLISLVAYLVSQLCTWIPQKNLTIPNLLYKLPFQLTPRTFRLMFMLDEFISTLNNSFLGFSAFSFFKFTKLTFYQFLFGISVTYMMIKKRFNE